MLLRMSNLAYLTQIAYKQTCGKSVGAIIYKISHFLPKLSYFTSKIRLFTSNLRNFAMQLHPYTETDVESFKVVFLDSNNL